MKIEAFFAVVLHANFYISYMYDELIVLMTCTFLGGEMLG